MGVALPTRGGSCQCHPDTGQPTPGAQVLYLVMRRKVTLTQARGPDPEQESHWCWLHAFLCPSRSWKGSVCFQLVPGVPGEKAFPNPHPLTAGPWAASLHSPAPRLLLSVSGSSEAPACSKSRTGIATHCRWVKKAKRRERLDVGKDW